MRKILTSSVVASVIKSKNGICVVAGAAVVSVDAGSSVIAVSAVAVFANFDWCFEDFFAIVSVS